MLFFHRSKEAVSPTGLTGQAFKVNAVADGDLLFHRTRAEEVRQSIADLKSQNLPTAEYERALRYHLFHVEHLSV